MLDVVFKMVLLIILIHLGYSIMIVTDRYSHFRLRLMMLKSLLKENPLLLKKSMNLYYTILIIFILSYEFCLYLAGFSYLILLILFLKLSISVFISYDSQNRTLSEKKTPGFIYPLIKTDAIMNILLNLFLLLILFFKP